MNRLWMEAVVCRWLKVGLLGVLCLAGWSGWVKADSSGLSFEARMACQRSIEEVYWKHTIWPEENTSPKPPLSEVISEDELRKKVGGDAEDVKGSGGYLEAAGRGVSAPGGNGANGRDNPEP